MRPIYFIIRIKIKYYIIMCSISLKIKHVFSFLKKIKDFFLKFKFEIISSRFLNVIILCKKSIITANYYLNVNNVNVYYFYIVYKLYIYSLIKYIVVLNVQNSMCIYKNT